jgi:hypothetical protein
MLFDQDELEAWLKQGRIDETVEVAPVAESKGVDFPLPPIYHRNAGYR